MKRALIAGITGQDGSYLAEILLDKGYEVHGIVRAASTDNTINIKHLIDDVHLHKGDLGDPLSIYRAIKCVNPSEIYNEADQDHVSWSYDTAAYSYDITGGAVGRFLEMIKEINPEIKYFQPVSSNMFGEVEDENLAQTEETLHHPQSPYACAKSFAFNLVKYYREVHGLFASTGIFYNHESPRRSQKYVSHKITKTIARISEGLESELLLGDINMKIDWGYAQEYMDAAWKIMQLGNPDDFIICTGENHSIREFVEESFKQVGIDLDWVGVGMDESGYDKNSGKKYVGINPSFFRPGKTSSLVGDISKAREAFGFEPKVKFKEIAGMLIEQDLEEIRKYK